MIILINIIFFYFSFIFSKTINNNIKNSSIITGNIYYIHSSNEFIYKEGPYDPNSVVYASYEPTYEETGWDYLTIETYNGSDYRYLDEIKSYAMGYIEGILTYKRIYYSYINLNHYKYYKNDSKMYNNTYEFFRENLNFMKYNSLKNKDNDSYWNEVYNLYKQMIGLYEGYNLMANDEEKIDLISFQNIISLGDIDEIEYWKNISNRPNYKNMTLEQIKKYTLLHNHCTSLIKILPDFSDIFFGHNTWTGYNKLIRIFKEYKFIPNPNHDFPGKIILMSSYPGAINSQDDFYITSADLYITETTNNVFNETLFDFLNPNTLMCWIRTMVANRLSNSGKEWVNTFKKYNSGTYNNQFQILDMKKIDLNNQKVEDSDVLWIIEQLPNYTEEHDVTQILKYGYWPSYNVPYSKYIFEYSGYKEYIEKFPELFNIYDYNNCGRAKIIRRDNYKIKDIESFQTFLRYNDFKNDNFSDGDACNSIACRSDLYEDKNIECFGATDAKFTSLKNFKENGYIYIISGPTNDQQKIFDWNDTFCNKNESLKEKWAYYGQINKYNFDWQIYKSKLIN
jgi:hypothetical protein